MFLRAEETAYTVQLLLCSCPVVLLPCIAWQASPVLCACCIFRPAMSQPVTLSLAAVAALLPTMCVQLWPLLCLLWRTCALHFSVLQCNVDTQLWR